MEPLHDSTGNGYAGHFTATSENSKTDTGQLGRWRETHRKGIEHIVAEAAAIEDFTQGIYLNKGTQKHQTAG